MHEPHAIPQSTTTHYPAQHSTAQLEYDGRIGALYKIWLVNIGFLIITLGIYRAWAKTRMRKYLWAHIRIFGDTLYYRGTGGELFKGFIIATILFSLATAVSALVLIMVMGLEVTQQELGQIPQENIDLIIEHCNNGEPPDGLLWMDDLDPACIKPHLPESYYEEMAAKETLDWIGIALLLYLVYFARYSALRYRLTRTVWRGIRGRLNGSANKYAFLALWRTIVNIITLGFLIPHSDMVKQAFIMNDVSIGSQHATFTNNLGSLSRINITTGILFIPTIGLSRLWYMANVKNQMLANIAIGGITLRGTYTGLKLLDLYAVNLLFLLGTLGLATPYIVHRTIRFHTSNTHIIGNIASTTILQSSGDANAVGEGFADDFDTGIDMDFGII